jgi:hypothetical protein
MGHRALIDGNADYLARLTARSPVLTGVPSRTDLSRYPFAHRQLLRRTYKTLWPEDQEARIQAGVASTH